MKICSNTSEHIIELNNENTNREIGNLVQEKFDSIKDNHAKEAIHDNNFNLKIQSGIKSIIFHSLEKMRVNHNLLSNLEVNHGNVSEPFLTHMSHFLK